MGPEEDEDAPTSIEEFRGVLETGEGEPSATEILQESRELDDERLEALIEKYRRDDVDE
jgi:hypothetical protein